MGPPAPRPDAPPLPSDQDATGRTLGADELALLREVIESGTLTSTKGTMVRRFERAAAEVLRVDRAVACASGTAAIHAAVAAVDPEPGEEIVTTPITDMGALTPLLYQGAVPTFADVDPRTGNLTADTVERALSDRTRAVIVTHLFGNPADVHGIRAVAGAAGVPVIEDCAQAWLATSRGEIAGTIGDLACWSMQQGKHITCGEGGLVSARDDATSGAVERWVNKGWGYGDADPDHRSLAPNARLSELQGAVALAQLGRLARNIERRRAMAARLAEALAGLPGLTLPAAAPGDEHAWWRYPLLVEPDAVPGGPAAVAAGLKAWTVAAAPRYIGKPAFECGIFRDQKTLGSSRWPFSIARPAALDYDRARFPGTYAFLDRVLVLPWNERLEPAHVDHIAEAIHAAIDSARSTEPSRSARRPSATA